MSGSSRDGGDSGSILFCIFPGVCSDGGMVFYAPGGCVLPGFIGVVGILQLSLILLSCPGPSGVWGGKIPCVVSGSLVSAETGKFKSVPCAFRNCQEFDNLSGGGGVHWATPIL